MDAIPYFRIKTINAVLLVADIERSIAFYTKELGFAIDFRYEDFYAGLAKDGCSIHLKAGKPSAEERKNRRSNEDIDILFSVDKIEDIYKEISGRHVEIARPLRAMPYGKEFYVADPDGYIIAFAEEI